MAGTDTDTSLPRISSQVSYNLESLVDRNETSKHITNGFIVKRMTGGSFIKIIRITVIDPNDDHHKKRILRVPRIAWMSQPDRETAVLR